MKGAVYIVSIVSDDGKVVVLVLTAELLYLLYDVVCRLNDVGITVLINSESNGVLPIEAGIAGNAGLLLRGGSKGGKGYPDAIAVLYHDILDIPCLQVLGNDTDIGLLRIGVDTAGGQQLVFIFQGGDNIRHGELVGCHLVLIDLDGDFPVTTAVQLYLRYAGGLLNDILKGVIRLGVNVCQRSV